MAFDRTIDEIVRDFVVDGVPSSGPHKPSKSHLRAWGTEVETLLASQLTGGGFMYATKAALDGDLTKAAGSGAWVYADTTAANNGIYRKIGNAGSGSWARATDLPFSVIGLTVTGGTANAIECSSALPVPQGNRSALFLLSPTAPNTAAVTLVINGGSAVPLRWLNGTELSANHLQTSNTVLFFKNGADYRLTQDSSAAGYVAAAAASAAAAATSAAAAEDSADRVDLGALDAAVAATAADALATAADRIAAAGSAAASANSEVSAANSAVASNAATPIHPDIATGRAAVADGQQFRVRITNGDIEVYTRNSSSTQTFVTTLPGAATVASVSTVTLGRATPVAGTAWLGTIAIRPDEMISPGNGYLTEFAIWSTNAGALTLWVVDEWLDGSTVRVRATAAGTYPANAGLTVVAPNLPWLAGQKIVLTHTGLPHFTNSLGPDPGVLFTSAPTITADAGGTVLGSVSAAVSLQARAVWSGSILGETRQPRASASRLLELYKASAIEDTGWRLTETAVSEEHRAFASVTFDGSREYELSVEFKSSNRRLWLFSNSKLLVDAVINAASGTIVPGTNGYTQTLSIIPVGDGVYRAVVRATTTPGVAATNLQLRLVQMGAVVGPYLGDGSSGGWVRDVQLRAVGDPGSIVTSDISNAQWAKAGLATVTQSSMGSRTLSQRLATLEVGTHPLSGRRVSLLGTSLVVQGLMPSSFASRTGCTLQSLGVAGGALGLDARGSPHAGSGAITALLPSINTDAEVIIMDMLVNDVAASDVPLGTRTDTTTATYRGALANFFNWCETNRPNAAVAVVVQTSAAATYSPSDYRHDVANAKGNFLHQFQEATREMCLRYGRPFIDPSALGISFLDMGDHTGDGLHWDVSGADRVSRVMSEETRRFAQAGWLG